jgi:excisionase family DNA binding protein
VKRPTEIVKLPSATIVKSPPARNDNVENDNLEVITIDIDPMMVVKTIAAGVCAAGIALIERHRGRQLPPAAPARERGDVMTADEVAAFLGVDRNTVYDYAGRGVIPHQRLGKRMLFRRGALTAWLDASRPTKSG